MPPSDESVVHRLELIESELSKAQSEYPSDSALDRVKFVRALVRLVKGQIELEEEAIPVLQEEVHHWHKEYRRR